jgi:hypothetical protein
VAAFESGTSSVARRLGKLDAWLETMRQEAGYAGPVAHWWGSTYQYAGPGLDWRYQGLLAGYGLLAAHTGQRKWLGRTNLCALHLIRGQSLDGSYPQSRFEANPGTLGTPHEAAAAHGLLLAADVVSPREAAVASAARCLDHLLIRFWDPIGAGSFNDGLNTRGRVPNKLATMAEALMACAEGAADTGYLKFARTALDDILRFQVSKGPLAGAVHQWSPDTYVGDGRFFPYYNARCVPALLKGAVVYGTERYREGAELILDFLTRVLNQDGTWPQLVYAGGHRVEYPHWVAPTADMLLAYKQAGRAFPPGVLARLWQGALATGAYRTADGFGSRYKARAGRRLADYRDVTAVVGWNDKVLRLAAELAPDQGAIPDEPFEPLELVVGVGTDIAIWKETADRITMTRAARPRDVLFDWAKRDVWAKVHDVRLLA